MKLYHSQGACSLAPHIALQEVGAKFSLEPVNLKTKTWRDGDFTKVNPKGQVPTLQLDSGDLLTECAVTLQYIADLKPEAQLLPKQGTAERWKALEALNFVATEIHKGFGPLWNPMTPPEFKETTKQTLAKKFDYISQRLAGGKFMLGSQYSVVDSYLFTVLNWSGMQGIDLNKWPDLVGYMERVRSRPAVQAALKTEGLIKKRKSSVQFGAGMRSRHAVRGEPLDTRIRLCPEPQNKRARSCSSLSPVPKPGKPRPSLNDYFWTA